MDIDMLKELLAGGKPLDPNEKDASMSVLKQIHDLAMKSMGDDVTGGLKQVTVAAPDDKGVGEGLDLAKGLVGGKGDESKEDPIEEAKESPEAEKSEDALGDLSPEEIDALLAELQARKTGLK
jgi:hypothetical protein